MKTIQQSPEYTVRSLERTDLAQFLPPRDAYAHKGDFGKAALVCGAVGYTGAAALASRAALRTGCGLVFTLTPAAVYPILAAKLDEAIVLPVPCDTEGRIHFDAQEKIHAQLGQCDSALFGPGLGRSEDLTRLLPILVARAACPLVVDADGLNAFAGHIDRLREAVCPVILTPHDGEFARLLPNVPLPRSDLTARCRAAAMLAEQSGCIVLLKGHRTVITDGSEFYVNCTGNAGMAKGGSGDVLAGIIVSLLAQGVKPLMAAALGAWLHGAAGDRCAQELGQRGMLPGDMIPTVARLLREAELP